MNKKVYYIGDFNNGKRDGSGSLIGFIGNFDYSIYDGEWRNNKKHGQGKYFFNNQNNKKE